ncbi:MAG: N-acetylglucosamine kinase [Terriglobales bacterium]
MSVYLGIDGGGSKTTCVAADEVRVLGSAMAGGSNINRVGRPQARASIQQAIRQACAAADTEPSQVVRTCLGLAGFSNPEVAAAARQFVSEVVPGDVAVVGDMEIAYEAAFGSGTGLVIIAGTGSIAYGQNDHGVTLRSGGHGPATSDEGSAHWIGRTAFFALLDPAQRRRGPLLFAATLIALGLCSLEDLEQLSRTSTAPDFAELFPQVCATAQAGDELAQEILTTAGGELAKLADDVAYRLWPENQMVRIALAGGVFKHSPIVRQSFCLRLREQRQNVTVSLRVVDPVMGALTMARKGKCAGANP